MNLTLFYFLIQIKYGKNFGTKNAEKSCKFIMLYISVAVFFIERLPNLISELKFCIDLDQRPCRCRYSQYSLITKLFIPIIIKIIEEKQR